jgi:hypothetical protein
MVGSGWNRENPATGDDHRITASAFLPFSGVFPRVSAENPRNYRKKCLLCFEVLEHTQCPLDLL